MNRHILLFCFLMTTHFMFGQVLDPTFQPIFQPDTSSCAINDSLAPIRYENIRFNKLAVDGNGKLLINGTYGRINGSKTMSLARLNFDGSKDITFDPVGISECRRINNFVVQPNGKILVNYYNYYEYPVRDNVTTRLLTDGQTDTLFAKNLPPFYATKDLRTVNFLPNDQILLWGAVFGLLEEDGTPVLEVKEDFLPERNFQGFQTVAVQPDGKILMGGTAVLYEDNIPYALIRLNPDLTLDESFPIVQIDRNSSNRISAIKVLPNGTIILGGSFSSYQGEPVSNGLLFINTDGTIQPKKGLKEGFKINNNSGEKSGFVNEIFLLDNGLIALQVSANTYNGVPVGRTVILDQDANLIVANTPAIRGRTDAITVDETNNLIYYGGNFNGNFTPPLDPTIPNNLVRINVSENYLSDTLAIEVVQKDTCLLFTDKFQCKSTQSFQAALTRSSACGALSFNWSIATNGNILAQGEGRNFDYEIDYYTAYDVTFTVSDTCGNQSIVTEDYTFLDCQGPNLEVLSGQVLKIGLNKSTVLKPRDLIATVTDNCTDSTQIINKIATERIGLFNDSSFSVESILALPDSLILSCNNTAGTQLVYIYSVDERGNYWISQSFIIVQIGLGVDCEITPVLHQVLGNVSTVDGEGIDSVVIAFSSAIKEFDEVTDEEGNYAHILPRGNYELTPYRADDPANGVSTFDLVLMRQHILGNKPFENEYQFIAADANFSGSITTFDLVILSKLILGVSDPFGNESGWIFLSSDYDLGSGIPNLDSLPTSRIVQTSLEVDSGFDFIGIKKGDVNISAKVNNLDVATDRKKNRFSISTQEQFLQKGKTYTTLFNFPDTQPLAGYQLSIQTNDLHLKEINGQLIETGTFSSDKIHSWLAKDRHHINLNWLQAEEHNKGQFSLTFTASKSGYLSDLLQLNQRDFVNEGYTSDLETMDLTLDFQAPEISDQNLAINISPNPIRLNHTMLTIDDAPSANLWIKIYNAQGQLVNSYQENFGGGRYEKRLKLPNSPGTYWAHVYTGGGQLQQLKLVKL